MSDRERRRSRGHVDSPDAPTTAVSYAESHAGSVPLLPLSVHHHGAAVVPIREEGAVQEGVSPRAVGVLAAAVPVAAVPDGVGNNPGGREWKGWKDGNPYAST